MDRRKFMAWTGCIPIAVLAISTGAKAQGEACYDPAALSFSQKSRRKALRYLDATNDPQKRCALCSYFTAGKGGCGTCALLASAVNAGGICSSFALRAK